MISFLEKKFNLICAALLFLFFAFRLVLLLTSPHLVLDPEEFYRGTIAKEILSGLKMPLWDYQADEYAGGSLAVGVLAVPFFKIFGPSLFALKCVPFLVSFLIFFVSMIFLRENFGSACALAGGLMLLFSPPAFTRLSLVAMGYHSESLLFTIGILFFFYRFLYAHPEKRLNYIGAGFFSGLGVWCTPILVVSVLTCLSSWIIQSPESFKRKWRIFFFPAFIGYLPWFFYNLTHGASGLYFLKAMWIALRDHQGGGFVQVVLRNISFAGYVFPLSFCFLKTAFSPGWILSFLYTFLLLCLVVAGLRTFRELKKSRLLAFLIFPVLFFVFFWVRGTGAEVSPSSSFIEFRYFMPLQFFLILLASAVNPFRHKMKTIFFALLFLGAAGQAELYFKEPFAQIFKYKGYSYTPLAKLTGQTWPSFFSSFEDFWKSLDRYPRNDRYYMYSNSAYGLQFEKDKGDAEKIKRLLAQTPEMSKRHLAEGAGYALGAHEGMVFDSVQNLVNEIPGELQPYFFSGMITGNSSEHSNPLSDYVKYASKIPVLARPYFFFTLGQIAGFSPEDKVQIGEMERSSSFDEMKWFYRGAGQNISFDWLITGLPIEEAFKMTETQIPEKYRDDLAWGIGWGIRRVISEDRVRALDVLHQLPSSLQPSAREGFDLFERDNTAAAYEG